MLQSGRSFVVELLRCLLALRIHCLFGFLGGLRLPPCAFSHSGFLAQVDKDGLGRSDVVNTSGVVLTERRCFASTESDLSGLETMRFLVWV